MLCVEDLNPGAANQPRGAVQVGDPVHGKLVCEPARNWLCDRCRRRHFRLWARWDLTVPPANRAASRTGIEMTSEKFHNVPQKDDYEIMLSDRRNAAHYRP